MFQPIKLIKKKHLIVVDRWRFFNGKFNVDKFRDIKYIILKYNTKDQIYQTGQICVWPQSNKNADGSGKFFG